MSHEPRPSLTLIPPPDADKRPMSFKFIDAVQRLPANFTKAEWSRLYDKVGARLHLNQLRKVFVILKDDDRKSSDGPRTSNSNSFPVSAHTRGRGGRGGYTTVPGVRKRAAESETTQPTPSKSARGRV